MVFRWLYLSSRTQVASILLRFLPRPNDWTHFRDIPRRLVLAVDMMRWMQSIHQMQICLPHHSAHTCSSCVCSAGLIRGKMAGGGANGSHGGSLDAISLSCSRYLIKNASWKLVGHRCLLQRGSNPQYSQHVLTR